MIVFSLKAALLASVFLFQAEPPPAASPKHFRYEREVTVVSGALGTSWAHSGSQACAVLDGQVFAHAASSLKDIRLYRGESEVPYATTLSEPIQQDSEDARILNLGIRSGRISFDLEMPRRPYTNVTLDLADRDYIAIAEVTGSSSLDFANATQLGRFTLFDLSAQHLSNSSSIALPESSFAYLHVEMSLSAAPGRAPAKAPLNRPAIVKAATVPPSREAQTVYTTLKQTSTLIQRGRESVASFELPVHEPVERIAFALDPSFKGNFSRAVRITARVVPRPNSGPAEDDSGGEYPSPPANEVEAGSILRVHETEDGHDLAQESLAVPAAIGSNMQHPARLEVAIENGDDPPLPVSSVSIEMRQRRICFDPAPGTSPLTLYYGDPALDAPTYDYSKLFRPAVMPLTAILAPETPNPNFEARPEDRSFAERHPELLWIVLLAVVCMLALTAIRAAKRLPR
jgi:hypothetical protein